MVELLVQEDKIRVTNRLMADTVLNSLYKNTQQLLKLQEMVSSEKRINRPSDDPIGMGKILDYRKVFSSIDQYNTNITRGKTQIDLTESCLKSEDIIQLKKAFISDQTIELIIREKVIETCAFTVQEILDLKTA